jgi:riboflavin biosynthesis pyrimidine reductase
MGIGGATLARAIMRAGLIDEYALATHPVLVGARDLVDREDGPHVRHRATLGP